MHVCWTVLRKYPIGQTKSSAGSQAGPNRPIGQHAPIGHSLSVPFHLLLSLLIGCHQCIRFFARYERRLGRRITVENKKCREEQQREQAEQVIGRTPAPGGFTEPTSDGHCEDDAQLDLSGFHHNKAERTCMYSDNNVRNNACSRFAELAQ